MPSCCIVKCGARKNKNQPQLSLHLFPKNEIMRKKWLESIGEENINPRHKDWYVCSLHFVESCFNRTLDVIRLHENSVPTIFPVSAKSHSKVLRETSNIQSDVSSSTLTLVQVPREVKKTVQKQVENEKIKALKEKCMQQKKKIKRLNEKIRRKEKKIANLKDIITDLQQKNQINMEQINILTCSSKNPIKALNELTNKESFAEITEDHSDLYENYTEHILTHDDDKYTDSVLEYIAGFVTKKLLKSIKCDICTTLLLGEEDVNSLIYQKSRGGLKYASYSVTEIIKKSEKLIKTHLEKQKPELYYLYIFKFLCEVCDVQNYFSADKDLEHSTNHRLLLIKSVIKTFLDIRFRYYGHIRCEKVTHRQFLNKLILFRNE